MLIPLILFTFIVIIAARPSISIALQSYNSIPQTQAIKGIFVITIFFSHFCSYVDFNTWYDVPMQKYCSFLGQLMVAPFLFYSGYGIFESIKKKGGNYVKTFPKERILKTLLHFDFAILLFLIFDLIIGRSFSTSEFLLSLVAWKSIGNSNWFIFAILCAYLFAYIGLLFFKVNLKRALFLITALSLAYILVISHLKSNYWVDTMLAFPLGCFFSLYKENFEKMISKHFVSIVAGIFCILVLLFAKSGIVPSKFVNSQIALIAFSFAIIFISLHIRLNSKILNWFGSQVFGIYLLQRLPMNYFSSLHLNENNIYLFFAVCFFCTLVLSVLFTKWNKFFDNTFLKSAKH